MDILTGFGNLGIAITKTHVEQMEKMVVHFLMRGTHPLTFNSAELGVNPIAFKTSDYNALFEVFDVHIRDVDATIRKIPAINRNFAVISDPFNLLSYWLVHLAPIYLKDKKVCYRFQFDVMKLATLRQFCSATNNAWRHGAQHSVILATIANLTLKSDIIRLESWNRLIDEHVEKILDPNDRFYKKIIAAEPDQEFLTVIGENQTAIRRKVVSYANTYYELHKAGESMKYTSAIAQNAEGEKILAQTASVVESSTTSMLTEILNPNMFVHDSSIRLVSNEFSLISDRVLKNALLRFNESAILQARTREFNRVNQDKDGVTYIGIRSLIFAMSGTLVRLCRTKAVNMGDKKMVFKTIRDALGSSRLNDPDIVAIKRSIGVIIDPYNITRNEPTKLTLRLAVLAYIYYRLIIKMKV